MAYSRWSNSEWYTYWCVDSSEVGDELLCIQKRDGQSSYVVWDEYNPAEMEDVDICALIPWKALIMLHRKNVTNS